MGTAIVTRDETVPVFAARPAGRRPRATYYQLCSLSIALCVGARRVDDGADDRRRIVPSRIATRGRMIRRVSAAPSLSRSLRRINVRRHDADRRSRRVSHVRNVPIKGRDVRRVVYAACACATVGVLRRRNHRRFSYNSFWLFA